MRLWNEVATIILFAVVFLVVLKSAFNWIYGLIGMFALIILLMLGIRWYKKVRERNPNAWKQKDWAFFRLVLWLNPNPEAVVFGSIIA